MGENVSLKEFNGSKLGLKPECLWCEIRMKKKKKTHITQDDCGSGSMALVLEMEGCLFKSPLCQS